MATNYDLLYSQSSIQVLSPTVSIDAVVCTIQTKPHRVILDYWVAKEAWDAGTAPAILEAVAGGVEHIMHTEPVSGAVGSTQLDANGLQAEFVTFTVAYQVPGSNTGPATVDQDVPVTDFGQDTFGGHNYGLEDASNLIQDAYAKLKAASDG